MSQRVHIELAVHRDFDEASSVFSRDPHAWLPVIVGPDEGTWRTDTREGPVEVRVTLRAGSVFVHRDRSRWRRLGVRPDRTAEGNLLTAMLTPTIEGHVGLVPTGDGECLLRFEGASVRRSLLTARLERLLVGDVLGRSGVRTMLEHARRRLEEEPADPDDESGSDDGAPAEGTAPG